MLLILGSCRAQDSYCPKSIRTKQTVEAVPEGWKAANGKGEHFLAALTIFEGPPEQEASLVYDSYLKGTSTDEAIWKFDPAQHIWISCVYQGTVVTLSKALPEKTTECKVRYSRSVPIDGYQQIEQVTCK